MKKQFLLGVLMIFIIICLVPFNRNQLKACNKNTAGCSIILKKPVKEQAGFVEDADAFFNMFMNPLSQL